MNESLERLSRVDQETVVSNVANTMQDYSKRMFNEKLMALRAQNPFLGILGFPNGGFSVQLQPGVAVDINLPSDVKLIFPSGDQVYYLSRNGTAQVPKAPTQGQGEYGVGSYQNPENVLLYVEEVSQLSVISPVICNFTCGFYSQQ